MAALAFSLIAACSASTSSARTASTTPPAAEPAPASAPAPQSAPAPATASTSEPAPAPPLAASAPAEPALPAMPEGLHGPSRPWAQMNAHDRAEYMEHQVMPVMQSLFQGFDAQHYAQVRCTTCHGANARQVRFHMPNTLTALPAPGSPAWNAIETDHPRMWHFMRERVVPAMATLLGTTPYNPQTHQGFGCFGCHPHG